MALSHQKLNNAPKNSLLPQKDEKKPDSKIDIKQSFNHPSNKKPKIIIKEIITQPTTNKNDSKGTIEKKAYLIGKYLLSLLNEDKVNHVSTALESLDHHQKANLFHYWAHSDETDLALLYLYYLPLPEWKGNSFLSSGFLDSQFTENNPQLPKHLLSSLKVKKYFFAENADYALALIKKQPSLNLNLEGLPLNRIAIDDPIFFQDLNLSGTNFVNAQLSGVIIHNVDLSDACFKQASLEFIVFLKCNISSSNFNDAVLKKILIVNTDLKNTSLQTHHIEKLFLCRDSAQGCDLSIIAFLILMRDGKLKINIDNNPLAEGREEPLLPATIRNCISEQFFRDFFNKQELPEELKPIKDYFIQWPKNHKVYSFFGKEPSLKEYLAAILLLALAKGVRKFDQSTHDPFTFNDVIDSIKDPIFKEVLTKAHMNVLNAINPKPNRCLAAASR